MNRRRQETAGVRISDEEYSRLENKFEGLKNEFIACKRKLDSKCEALLILSRELDQCRSERDQFKLMAEQLRERHQSIKKQLSGQLCEPVAHFGSNQNTEKQSQNLMKILVEVKDQNKSLHFELEDTKQKLLDAQGDIKLLREQIARQRVGTTDEGMNTRHFPAHEREELVQKLESSRDQLERDLQTVLDEKEELVTERDVFKTKYERLNQELNYILKGDENRVVDIDALVMENKYLQDRLTQMEAEKSMAIAAVSKYKSILEKRKNKSCMKLGQTRGGGMVISQKQVQEVLTSKAAIVPTPQAMSDLQALAGALLDTVNDKNLALSHQRKTNKILGSRVAELEKKIKTLEVAGLWNVSSHGPVHLEKLIQECNDMKTLIPQRVSHHSESDQQSEEDKDSELESVTPLDSCTTTPDLSPTHTANVPDHLKMEDLDLLPTKEVACKPACTENMTENIDLDDKEPMMLNSIASIETLSTEYNKSEKKTFLPEKETNIHLGEGNDPEKDSGVGNDPHEQEIFMENNTGIEKSQNEDQSNDVNDLKSDQFENSKCCENLLSVTDGESVGENNQVHVYNEDKLEELDENDDADHTNFESINRELDLDLDEKQMNELDLNASGDANIFNITKRTRNTEDFVLKDVSEAENSNADADNFDDDVEATEKIGLLVESMALKMCNISHKDVQRDCTMTSNDNEDTDHEDSSGKLLGDTRDQNDSSHPSQTKEDEPRNVEC